MPDELPAETGGAPESPQPSVDWEKRYTDTHAEYNRLNETLRRFESDPSALVEFIREKHPDMLAEDEEEEDTSQYEETDPTAGLQARLDKFEQWQQQQVVKEGKALFNQDLKEVAGDRTVSRQGKDWIELQVQRGGNNRGALEAATKEWFEYEDSLKGPSRRTAPAPPQQGKAAALDPNSLKDPQARRNERRERMAAQIAAGEQ